MTLEPDVEELVKALMDERGISFKEAVNLAIRRGLSSGRTGASFSTPTFAMGAHPKVNLDKALRLAAELEDEEVIREIAARK